MEKSAPHFYGGTFWVPPTRQLEILTFRTQNKISWKAIVNCGRDRLITIGLLFFLSIWIWKLRGRWPYCLGQSSTEMSRQRSRWTHFGDNSHSLMLSFMFPSYSAGFGSSKKSHSSTQNISHTGSGSSPRYQLSPANFNSETIQLWRGLESIIQINS